MDLESVKRNLERGIEAKLVNGMPWKSFEPLFMNGLRVDLIEPGRIVCSMKIPPRLINSKNSLESGAIAALVDVAGAAAIPSPNSSGVSVEINVTYFDAAYVDEEIEIDARLLRAGMAVAVVSVELRNKKTGKVFAEGRHTKFLAIASKL